MTEKGLLKVGHNRNRDRSAMLRHARTCHIYWDCGSLGARRWTRLRSLPYAGDLQRPDRLRCLEKAVTVIERRSTITCPLCGHQVTETMPNDFCQFYYDCHGCGDVLRPNKGDCCVFRSFGTAPCPPIQDVKERGEQPACRRH